MVQIAIEAFFNHLPGLAVFDGVTIEILFKKIAQIDALRIRMLILSHIQLLSIGSRNGCYVLTGVSGDCCQALVRINT